MNKKSGDLYDLLSRFLRENSEVAVDDSFVESVMQGVGLESGQERGVSWFAGWFFPGAQLIATAVLVVFQLNTSAVNSDYVDTQMMLLAELQQGEADLEFNYLFEPSFESFEEDF